MTTFIVVAAVMAALAAAAVAVPLCRDRQSRMVGALAGVLIAGAAAALYPLWSNWKWNAPAEAQAAGPTCLPWSRSSRLICAKIPKIWRAG